MKAKKILPLLFLVGVLGLVSCKDRTSSSGPSGSSEQSVATSISDEPSTSTEATEPPASDSKESEVPVSEPSSEVPSSEVPSSEDPVSSEPGSSEPDEPDLEVVALVQVTRGEENVPLTSASESSGAYRLTVTVENLPDGVTLDDLEFVWPKTTVFADFHAIVAGNEAKNVYEMTVMNAGPLKIEVSVKHLGEVLAVASMAFTITQDLSRYTEIKSAGEFIELIARGGTIIDKYILGANIDLGGYIHDGKAVNATFNGVLDGNGYKVSNFTEAPAGGVDGGLFYMMPSGIVRNIHIQGNVNAAGGWSGLLTKEIGQNTVVINSIFEATDITPIAGVDWTWQRNGVIAGFLRGLVENVVSVKISDNDRMVATIPYSHGNRAGADAMATLKNVYTNIAAENLAIPFAPDPGWSSPAEVSDLHLGLGDFSETKASDFDLDPAIFVLEDGKMPVLQHFGEEAAVLAPKLELAVTKKALKLESEDSATVTASLENNDEPVVWSYELAEEGVIGVLQEDNIFTVTPLAEGSAILKVIATVGEDVYEDEVAFTVTLPAEGGEEQGEYEVPENAFEISDAASFKAFFNGSAANNGRNALLTADIDLDGISIGMGMAGEYTGIFEGQGYKVSNYTCSQTLFNIVKADAEIRNVKFALINTTSGFSPVAFRNDGTIKNVEVEITLNVAVNTYAGIALAGIGKISDCHVDWIFGGESGGSNTLYPIAQDDAQKDITNCSYSITGGNVSQFVTTNSNITLIS